MAGILGPGTGGQSRQERDDTIIKRGGGIESGVFVTKCTRETLSVHTVAYVRGL